MKKKLFQRISVYVLYGYIAVSIVIGFLLYRVFMGFYPETNIDDLFLGKTGIPAFYFVGITAGVLICIPVIILALQIFSRLSNDYLSVRGEKGIVFLSKISIESFIRDTVSGLGGVHSTECRIEIFKESFVGINLWIDADEKNDFVRFSERIQQRVLQDLQFNFGIEKIKFFNLYLESTDILSETKGAKVTYK
ncbi:MAG: hypothetical protein A2Y33_00550 [Spirochaetes bacterium GWF1_51_8]|nr:MAG: hypothetical protein A2Y33_00550 [Spirochaetes bacterium GWF1_51_8]